MHPLKMAYGQTTLAQLEPNRYAWSANFRHSNKRLLEICDNGSDQENAQRKMHAHLTRQGKADVRMKMPADGKMDTSAGVHRSGWISPGLRIVRLELHSHPIGRHDAGSFRTIRWRRLFVAGIRTIGIAPSCVFAMMLAMMPTYPQG